MGTVTVNAETNTLTLTSDSPGMPPLDFAPFQGGVEVREPSTGIRIAVIRDGGGHWAPELQKVNSPESYFNLDADGYAAFTKT